MEQIINNRLILEIKKDIARDVKTEEYTKSTELFSFTDNEMISIGNEIKGHKFDYKGTELIYPTSSSQKLLFFVSSIRLIQNLANQYSGRNRSMHTKLNVILIKYGSLYVFALRLLTKLEPDVDFNKHRILRKIEIMFIENKDKIDALIDFIFPLGTSVKTVDPDEVQAYY